MAQGFLQGAEGRWSWRMLKEPYRIIRWKPRLEQVHGQLYTCARPGRSKGLKAKRIPDEWVDAWVKGLPGSKGVIIVSLLGQKPGGKSEFSFYSFRGNGRERRRGRAVPPSKSGLIQDTEKDGTAYLSTGRPTQKIFHQTH